VVNSVDGGMTWSDPVHVVDLEDGAADWADSCEAGCTLTGTALGGLDVIAHLVASPVDDTLYVVDGPQDIVP
jgi:hypothetical protein